MHRVTFGFAAVVACTMIGFAGPAAATTLARAEQVTAASLRQVSMPDTGPDIPGVTYPRRAPPDLVPPRAVPLVVEEEREASDASDAASASADATVAAAAGREPVERDTLKLTVDLSLQRLTVVEKGEVVHVWPISSGRPPYRTTTGTFRPQWASRMWYSRQYDMAPMPHAVFFNRGIAFHATNATHLLGRPASHGCVRLSPQNARLLYKMIHAHGYGHTLITVTGEVPSATAKREPERRKPRSTRLSNSPKPEAGFFWPFF